MTSSIPAQPMPLRIFRTAAVLGLVCGALDIAFAILRRAQSFEDLQLVFPSVFATAVVVALAFLLPWLLLGNWLSRRWQLAPAAFALAVAVALGTTFVSARIGEFSLRALSADAIFQLGLYSLGGIAAGIAAYLACAALNSDTRGRALAQASLFALPGLLLAMVLFLWSQLFWIESIKSLPGIVSCVVFALLAVAVLWRVMWPAVVARAWRWTIGSALLALLGPLVMLVLGQVGHGSAGDAAPHAVRHIVLLSSDTLRADVLGAYGNTRVPTPAIDSLAHDGVVFDKANSVAPWTLPSLSSLVSGVSPAVHLVRQEGDRLPSSITTLGERFAAAGYHTGAVVDNAYLRPKANLAQGFADYLFMNIPDYGRAFGPQIMRVLLPAWFRPERPATIEEHTAQVRAWIERNAERDFFLWVHFFDPHAPYEPKHEYVAGTPPTGMDYRFEQPPQVMSGLIARSDADKAWIRALYEAEVRGLDDNIASVLETLRGLDLYDGTLIAFTSDHGEEFWDHGAQGHGHTLFDELLRVPLIIKLPDSHAAQRVSLRVSTERLAPTLLEAADVSFEAKEMSGPSLLALIRSGSDGASVAPVVSETRIAIDNLQSITSNEQKFVRSLITDREQLYDLSRDPGETQSQLASGAELADAARKLLVKHETDATGLREFIGVASGESAEFDTATMNRLRGLGYIK